MKICPKCGTPNQNKNYYCVECNAVLSGAEVVSDEQYFASSKAIQKATKGDHKRKWIYFALFVFITLLIDVYILYMGSVSEGPNGGPFDLRNVYKLYPWYIPIVFTACFNFD